MARVFAVVLVLASLALIAAPARAQLTYERGELARVEETFARDEARGREEGATLRAHLRDRIGTLRGQADTIADQERQWRELADGARRDADESRERVAKYEAWLRDPLLEDMRETNQRWLERGREDVAADEARAAERDRRASDLRVQAEDLYDQVALLEELLARLEALLAPKPPEPDPPPPETASDTTTTPAPAQDGGEDGSEVALEFGLADVLGLWRSVEGPSFSMAIVQQNPGDEAYPYRLDGHTDRGVWKGNYTSLPEGNPGRSQNARVQLTYRPAWEEMNTEIPEWARQAVEGELVWRLEMDEAGDLLSPRLRVKWFRGEVRWSEEGERVAELVGDGPPRILELEPVTNVTVESLQRPTLSLQLAGTDHDPQKAPITALLKGQKVFPKVTLPADLARERGTSIQVTVRDVTGGDEVTVTLTSGGLAGNRPAVYSSPRPVAIADCDSYANPPRDPPVLSMFWLFSVDGACLDLDVENGGVVEVSYDGAFQRVTMYDTWVQRGLVQQGQALERLTAVYSGLLTGSQPARVKEKATKRLRMLTNLRYLRDSPDFTDLHKYAVGSLYLGDTEGPGRFIGGLGQECGMGREGMYLGLMLQSDEDMAALYSLGARCQANLAVEEGYMNPLMRAFIEGLTGTEVRIKAPDRADALVVWAFDAERFFVRKALRHTSQSLLSRGVKASVEGFAFGLYDGLATATPAGDLYLVVTGTDHMGKKRPTWERVMAGVGLASSAILELHSLSSAKLFNEPPVQRSRQGLGRSEKRLISGEVNGALRVLDDVDEVPDVPGRPSAAQRRQLSLLTEADPAATGQCPCARKTPDIPPRSLRPDPTPGVDPAEIASARRYVDRNYPEGTRILGDDLPPILAKQSGNRGTCNAMASNYIIYKGTGQVVGELDALDKINDIKVDQIFEARGTRKVRRDQRVRTVDSLSNGAGEPGGPGFDQFAIRDYLRGHGAKVGEVGSLMNWSINYRHIWSAMEKGFQVKLVISLGSEFHAVVIDGLNVVRRDGKLSVKSVRVYDSNVGRILEVPAKAFNDMIARNITSYGIMTLVKFGD